MWENTILINLREVIIMKSYRLQNPNYELKIERKLDWTCTISRLVDRTKKQIK